MSTTDPMDKLWAQAALDRRALMAAGATVGVVAGFHQLVQPVMAQTTIVTEPTGLETGIAQIPIEGKAIPAYFAYQTGAKSPPVLLVVQEIFGVHEHIKDVCRRLAKLGYLAIAPELYHRQGDVSKLTSIDDIRKIVAAVPDGQVMGDLDAVVTYVEAQRLGDTSRLGITGFCWGGRIVWLYAAHSPKIKAGVAWYGRLVGDKTTNTPVHPVDVAVKINAPVLGLYGGADTGIPVATVEQMRAALGKQSTSQIHVYPDMPHAFFADYRPSYRKEAADDGWKRCVDWFKANGVA